MNPDPKVFSQRLPATVNGQVQIKLGLKDKNSQNEALITQARELQNKVRKETKS